MNERSPVLFLFLTGAMASDAARGKIYNVWLLPAFFAGLCWRFESGGIPGGTSALCGAAAVILALGIFRRLGGIGGGDIKLLAVLSLFWPFAEFLRCAAGAFVLAAAAALPVIISERRRDARIHLALPIGAVFLAHAGGVF